MSEEEKKITFDSGDLLALMTIRALVNEETFVRISKDEIEEFGGRFTIGVEEDDDDYLFSVYRVNEEEENDSVSE